MSIDNSGDQKTGSDHERHSQPSDEGQPKPQSGVVLDRATIEAFILGADLAPEIVEEIDRSMDDPASLVSQIGAEYAQAARMMFDPERPAMGSTKPESTQAAQRVLQLFAAHLSAELESETPSIPRLANACRHIRSSLQFLGVTDAPVAEDPVKDAEKLVTLARAQVPSSFEALVANIRAHLKDGGPEIDWEALYLYEAGELTKEDEQKVRMLIVTWRSWHDTYWQLVADLEGNDEEAVKS